MPPLRERREDIPALCGHLVKTLTSRAVTISDRDFVRLMKYDWPGNVRELKNIIERAVLLQQGTILEPSTLLSTASPVPPAPCHTVQENERLLSLEEVERQHIQYVLDKLSGNYTRTAKALGISLTTLKRKLKS
jgi:DNA-binding NtrC family response regulator